MMLPVDNNKLIPHTTRARARAAAFLFPTDRLAINVESFLLFLPIAIMIQIGAGVTLVHSDFCVSEVTGVGISSEEALLLFIPVIYFLSRDFIYRFNKRVLLRQTQKIGGNNENTHIRIQRTSPFMALSEGRDDLWNFPLFDFLSI
jgi:hypothetical protein